MSSPVVSCASVNSFTTSLSLCNCTTNVLSVKDRLVLLAVLNRLGIKKTCLVRKA